MSLRNRIWTHRGCGEVLIESNPNLPCLVKRSGLVDSVGRVCHCDSPKTVPPDLSVGFLRARRGHPWCSTTVVEDLPVIHFGWGPCNHFLLPRGTGGRVVRSPRYSYLRWQSCKILFPLRLPSTSCSSRVVNSVGLGPPTHEMDEGGCSRSAEETLRIGVKCLLLCSSLSNSGNGGVVVHLERSHRTGFSVDETSETWSLVRRKVGDVQHQSPGVPGCTGVCVPCLMISPVFEMGVLCVV